MIDTLRGRRGLGLGDFLVMLKNAKRFENMLSVVFLVGRRVDGFDRTFDSRKFLKLAVVITCER